MTKCASQPTISLITPCFNGEKYITEAVESAVQQNYPALEHIIVDADSNDDTLAVLEKYPHLVVNSRKDQGIYDGLNRGLKLARGDIIGFLNVDDKLEPQSLNRVADAFATQPGLEMFVGGATIASADGVSTITTYLPTSLPSYQGIAFGVPVINARFFSRSFIERVGLFDTSLPCAGDRAWLLEMVTAMPSTAICPQSVYRYRVHSGSRTLAGSDSIGPRLWREHIRIADSYLQGTNTPGELVKLCATWRAVESLKLTLVEKQSLLSRIAAFGRLLCSDRSLLRSLPSGLRKWRHHRGQHSDML